MTTSVRVEVSDERVAAAVAAVIASYPTSDDPAVRYTLAVDPAPTLWRDGQVAQRVDEAIDLVAAFEIDLYRCVAERCDDRWVLHAAALVFDRGAVVLAGASGAGKSTMTLALLERGARYLSDECVAVGDAGDVVGLARAVNVSGAVPAQLPAGATVGRYPLHTATGVVDNAFVHPARDATVHAAVPVVALVHLRHDPTVPTRMRPLPAPRALDLLWRQTMNPGRATLVRAVTLLRALDAYELTTRAVPCACDAIADLARGDAVEPTWSRAGS